MHRPTCPLARATLLAWLVSGLAHGADAPARCDAGAVDARHVQRTLDRDDASAGLEYGPHGGVVGLAPTAYACIAYDIGTDECLVRAIREEEIAVAIAGGDEERMPSWMRTSLIAAGRSPPPPFPTEPAALYDLPGLLTVHLDPQQIALVRCLAGTRLGRPLAEWNDPWIYQRGLVEDCEREARTVSHTGDTPLAARHLQEAALIVSRSQRLVDASLIYSDHAGRSPGAVAELLESALLRSAPARTPSMTTAGYALHKPNRVTVDLQPGADDVCRALNMLQGRAWHSLPPSLPEGSRSGCYLTTRGFRFEFGG